MGIPKQSRPMFFRSPALSWCLLALRKVSVPAVMLATLATGRMLHSQQTPPSPPNLDRPYLIPEANRLPDSNDQMKLRDQQSKKQNFEAANTERKRQINDDSARLLKLATDLKAEVQKTNKDTLSLAVIRKAEEIEKLARDVKEKMKLTVGSN